MYKITIASIALSFALAGCVSMPTSKSNDEGGISTTTTALTAGAVITGVGLVAIPFLGPALAAAAMLSYGNDATAAAEKKQKECAAHYAEANRLNYRPARIRQMEVETGCSKQ